ncbi:hypothetical protein MB84_29260 (plasmid) [Pandoraea oxalativorans]|uniref:Uncharacterized protein n=2 Tax=Pandoraea oxalativorans TaxID=573737 RepID=A0A0G3IG93_9BURK|nr:hypothetical protein MB84_29260 [Pandoraea oxalativorans]
MQDKVSGRPPMPPGGVALSADPKYPKDQPLCTAIEAFVDGLRDYRSDVNACTGGAISFVALDACTDALNTQKAALVKGEGNHAEILKTICDASSRFAEMASEVERNRDRFAPHWALRALTYLGTVVVAELSVIAAYCAFAIAPYLAIPAALVYAGAGAGVGGLLAAQPALRRWAAERVQDAAAQHSAQHAALTTLFDNTRKLALRAETLATITALKARLTDAERDHFSALLDLPVEGEASDAGAPQMIIGQAFQGSPAQTLVFALQAGIGGFKEGYAAGAIAALGRLLAAEAALARGPQSRDAYQAFQSSTAHRHDLQLLASALVFREGFRPLVLTNVDCHGALSIDKAFLSWLQENLAAHGAAQWLDVHSLAAPPAFEDFYRGCYASDDKGTEQWQRHTTGPTFMPVRELPNDCLALRFGARLGPGDCIETVNGFYALPHTHQPRGVAALVSVTTTQDALPWPEQGKPFELVHKLRVLAALDDKSLKDKFGLLREELPTYPVNADLSKHKHQHTGRPIPAWLESLESMAVARANRAVSEPALKTDKLNWHALAEDVSKSWRSGDREHTFSCTAEDCNELGKHLGVTIIQAPQDPFSRSRSRSRSLKVLPYTVRLFVPPLAERIRPWAKLVHTTDTARRSSLDVKKPLPRTYA